MRTIYLKKGKHVVLPFPIPQAPNPAALPLSPHPVVPSNPPKTKPKGLGIGGLCRQVSSSCAQGVIFGYV